MNTHYGSYEIQSEIGRGGMGLIYSARHVDTGEMVALKVLPSFLSKDDMFLNRFTREVSNLKELNHPNIVQLIDAGLEADTHYYAMELLTGEPLWDKIKRGHMPESSVVEIAEQVLSAVDYAHTHSNGGYIHRDLKPDNIFLVDGNRVKIIDFGLSKTLQDVTLTLTGTNFGSPAFMSPEQFANVKSVDHRADIWSIGMCIYYALIGKTPFENDNAVTILRKLNDPDFCVPSVRDIYPELSEHIDSVIRKSTSIMPSARYQSAREFLGALTGRALDPVILDYDIHESYSRSQYIYHPIYKERGLIVDAGQMQDGLKYVTAEFPDKGRLNLVCGQMKS